MPLKFHVLTAYSNEYRELASLTEPTKIFYADRWGHTFSSLKHKNTERVAWERVEFWLKTLKQGSFDWLFFTGADAVITNWDVDLESFVEPGADFIFACDGCGLQSDSWLMRNCEETIRFLETVLLWEGDAPNEQDAMQLELSGERSLPNFLAGLPYPRQDGGAPCGALLQECLKGALNRSPVICKIVSQRELNAYPLAHYGGKGYEPWGWQKGDFVLHIPGKPLQERIDCIRAVMTLPLPF